MIWKSLASLTLLALAAARDPGLMGYGSTEESDDLPALMRQLKARKNHSGKVKGESHSVKNLRGAKNIAIKPFEEFKE